MTAVLVAVGAFLVASGGGPRGAAALQRVEVVDADAELRCQRLGYPCSWAEAGDAAADAALSLMDEVRRAMDAHTGLADQLRAGEAFLAARPGVVEVSSDREGFSALMFRLTGGLPVFVETVASGPISPEAVGDGAAPAGSAAPPLAVPASYKPTQAPGAGTRSALVFDPFADIEVWSTEARAVRDVLGGHSDYAGNVTYVPNPGLSDLRGWGGHDVVHITTHGASWCDQRYDTTAPNRCFSGFTWGRVAEGTALPPGLTFSDKYYQHRIRVTSEYFSRTRLPDTIVFISACQTAGARSEGIAVQFSGAFGALVGWDDTVYGGPAEWAAVEFWRLLVHEGLDIGQAYERLEAENLAHSSGAAYARRGLGDDLPDVQDALRKIEDTLGVSYSATLRTFGQNLRARDVITTFIDGSEVAAGGTIPTDGRVGDGQDDVIPEVRFLVEGVRDGTAATTEIEVRIDDEPLEPIAVADGIVVEEGNGWADWEVAVADLRLPFDLTKEDVDPDEPAEHIWDVRVFENPSRYSADLAEPVFFSGTLRAEGRLPIFDELQAGLAGTPGEVTVNLLYIEFPSDGGDVSGEFNAVLEFPAGGGSWTVELTGVYDAATRTMSGQAVGRSFGQAAGVSARDFGTGEFEARVDFDAGVVEGLIYGFDGSQPITAHF